MRALRPAPYQLTHISRETLYLLSLIHMAMLRLAKNTRSFDRAS